MPDATTLLRFRRLLEKHKPGEALFAKVGEALQASGLKVGTATIIGASSSTKNARKQRDPEMHQTRKGQQWFFGMKLHIGVASKAHVDLPGVVGKRFIDRKTKIWWNTTDLTAGDQACLRELVIKHAGALPPLRPMMRRRERLTFRRAFRKFDDRPEWEPVLRTEWSTQSNPSPQ